MPLTGRVAIDEHIHTGVTANGSDRQGAARFPCFHGIAFTVTRHPSPVSGVHRLIPVGSGSPGPVAAWGHSARHVPVPPGSVIDRETGGRYVRLLPCPVTPCQRVSRLFDAGKCR